MLVQQTDSWTRPEKHGLLPFRRHRINLESRQAAMDGCFFPESKQDCEPVLIFSSWVRLKPIILLLSLSRRFCLIHSMKANAGRGLCLVTRASLCGHNAPHQGTEIHRLAAVSVAHLIPHFFIASLNASHSSFCFYVSISGGDVEKRHEPNNATHLVHLKQ